MENLRHYGKKIGDERKMKEKLASFWKKHMVDKKTKHEKMRAIKFSIVLDFALAIFFSFFSFYSLVISGGSWFGIIAFVINSLSYSLWIVCAILDGIKLNNLKFSSEAYHV